MDKHFEFRRKAIHILFGILICSLIYFDLFYLPLWLGILFLVIISSFVLKKWKSYSKFAPQIWRPLANFIFLFEREEEIRKFPLRGALTFFSGCILSYILFPKIIAISAIITLFVGDSAVALYGFYFGRIKNPLSPKKHLDATIFGIILNSIFLALFLPFWKGFLASVPALILENFMPIPKIKKIFFRLILDDNILIPLIAGSILMLLV